MTIGSRPRISVGLPVFNGEAYLDTALRSLLDQSVRDFELIVSDNASTDRTGEICAAFAARDPRVRYHRNACNLGAAANFNRVATLARGAYFAWANHDDVWAPDYLERCATALDRDPTAVLAYARSAKIDAAGAVVAPLEARLALAAPDPASRLRRYHELFRAVDRRRGWHEDGVEGLWIPVYGLVRAESLRRTGLIGNYIASDTVLIEELLLLGRAIELDETLFFKRDHPGRSMRAHVAFEERHAWFTGTAAKRFLFPRHRILRERLRAVARARLPLADKAACLTEMLAFYVRRGHEGKALVKEIGINLRRLSPASAGAAPAKW